MPYKYAVNLSIGYFRASLLYRFIVDLSRVVNGSKLPVIVSIKVYSDLYYGYLDWSNEVRKSWCSWYSITVLKKACLSSDLTKSLLNATLDS